MYAEVALRLAVEPRSAAELLGDELLRLRLERGLSLRTLARLVGMTAHSGLVDYERGKRVPPNDLMSCYAQALEPPNGQLAQLYHDAVAERARRKLATIAARSPELIAVSSPPADDLTAATVPARTFAQYRENIVMVCSVAEALENAAQSLRDVIADWPAIPQL